MMFKRCARDWAMGVVMAFSAMACDSKGDEGPSDESSSDAGGDSDIGGDLGGDQSAQDGEVEETGDDVEVPCGDETCVDELIVAISLDDDASFSPGIWFIDLDLGTETASISCYVSLMASGPQACDVSGHAEVSATLDETGTVIVIVVGDTPSSADVEIGLDSQLKLQDTIQPTYDDYRPNGVGCDPVCQRAEVELVILN